MRLSVVVVLDALSINRGSDVQWNGEDDEQGEAPGDPHGNCYDRVLSLDVSVAVEGHPGDGQGENHGTEEQHIVGRVSVEVSSESVMVLAYWASAARASWAFFWASTCIFSSLYKVTLEREGRDGY